MVMPDIDPVSLSDAPDRAKMAKTLDENVVLLAGAGAGKTYALVERMVATIRDGRETVDHLAAITFTHKAAGEMRGRFHAALRRQLEVLTGPPASRVKNALENLDRCFIGTIHAFSARLLRERPLEAGLDPGFREVTEHQEVLLRRGIWDRFIQEGYNDRLPQLLLLPDLGLRAEDLYSFYSLRVRYAELPLQLADAHLPDLQPGVDLCLKFYDDHIDLLPDTVRKGRDSVQEALERSRHILAHASPQTNAERIAFITLWASAKKVTLNRWPDRDIARVIRDSDVPQLQEQLAPIITRWRQYVYASVVDLVDKAASLFADTCRRGSTLTFQQLLMEACRVLREVPDVRRWFQDRYRILFVDEFQDTDPVQAEIVFYLTGDDPAETDWRKIRPRRGSLVVVGDEKQSIYRFRRADVEIFQDVGMRIEEGGGNTLRLTSSFRSTGALCAWLNRALGPVLNQEEAPFQASFEPLHQVRPDGDDSTGVRKITIARKERSNRGAVAAEDSERIADFIAAALRGETEFNAPSSDDSAMRRKAEPGDFLLLTRTRAQLPEYARALESRGVPYDVVGAGALKRSQELRAVLQLLEAVIVPDNPVPVVAVLRGPLIGLGDDELYAYGKAGGRFDFTRKPPHGLSESLDARITCAFDAARSAATFIRTLPPSVAFERTLEILGLIPYAASGAMGSSRAGALLRAVALVRQWEGSGLSWTEILEEMRAVLDNPEYIVEDMTLEAGREDVVRLMVVHQAKGLEANVVFLADPADTGSRRHAIEAHVSRVREAATLSAPVVRKRSERSRDTLGEPPEWAESEAREKRFQAAENDRLLYVAATRARNLLVVSRYEGAPDKGPWSALEPALQDVEELPYFPTQFPYRPGSPDLNIDRGRQLRRERWESVRKPTFGMSTVTGSRDEFEPTTARRKGRGRDYGILVHELFEAAVLKTLPEDREAFIGSRTADRGLDGQMGTRALEALRAFENSDLWRELAESDCSHTEVPLVTCEGSESPAASTNDGAVTVLRGTIDLLFQTDAGWTLVDYKTDAAPDDAAVAAILDRYSDQVRTYARQWASVTGEAIARKGIWLTDGGRLLAV